MTDRSPFFTASERLAARNCPLDDDGKDPRLARLASQEVLQHVHCESLEARQLLQHDRSLAYNNGPYRPVLWGPNGHRCDGSR